LPSPIAIRFLDDAETEASDAERYYSSISPILGLDFVDVLDSALARLRAFPEIGAPHLEGTRRLPLDRFPLNLVYTLAERELVIVAVAHQRRLPGYWSNRL
jgi:plasmid stabilization system protein ParE